MVKEDLNSLKNDIKRIKKMGFIQCDYHSPGSAGIKLEKLLGINPENFEIPDYKSIEIKTKRSTIKKEISLFCATPDSYLFEIKRLHRLYAYPDKTYKNYKVLNNSVWCGKMTYISNNIYFSLRVDREKRKIFLIAHTRDFDIIVNQTSWSFEMLEEKLVRKLKYLCTVNMDKNFWQNQLYIRYKNDNYYKLRGFNYFIDLIECGKISVTFRIGVFKRGKRKGQIHDHGTQFNINEDDLELLFEKIIF